MLTEKVFTVHAHGAEHTTVDGTMHRASMLLLLVMGFGALTWRGVASGVIPEAFLWPVVIVSMVLGFAMVVTLMFKHEWAPYLAPAYGVVEGVFVGGVSLVFESMFPGIVINAILLTLAVALFMFVLYNNRIIKVTQKFRTIVILATFSIVAVYVVSFLLAMFGVNIPYIHEGGAIGIIFSLIVVTIAALNLLLDFDFIESAAKQRLPKHMEWIGAIALVVTIVWLYIEMIKLLAKIQSND